MPSFKFHHGGLQHDLTFRMAVAQGTRLTCLGSSVKWFCISNSHGYKIPLLKIQLMHLLCQLDKTKLKIKSH
jgi:hypothetical protein